jgi:hypothetical protein
MVAGGVHHFVLYGELMLADISNILLIQADELSCQITMI